MMAPIKTIYDTAVELALISIDSDGMDLDELSMAVYRKAAKFSAVLADKDVIEAIRYAESAEIKRVRITGVSEDGKFIFVTDPDVPAAKEEDEAEAKLEEAAEAALSEVPEAETGTEGDKPEDEPAKSEPEVVKAPEVEDKPVEAEKMEVACDGILGADIADVLPKCEGKVCDVYIGGTKHYSLMDLYCNSLAGKVVKIEIVGE